MRRTALMPNLAHAFEGSNRTPVDRCVLSGSMRPGYLDDARDSFHLSVAYVLCTPAHWTQVRQGRGCRESNDRAVNTFTPARSAAAHHPPRLVAWVAQLPGPMRSLFNSDPSSARQQEMGDGLLAARLIITFYPCCQRLIMTFYLCCPHQHQMNNRPQTHSQT